MKNWQILATDEKNEITGWLYCEANSHKDATEKFERVSADFVIHWNTLAEYGMPIPELYTVE